MNFETWYTKNVGITPAEATKRGAWDVDLLRKCFSDAQAEKTKAFDEQGRAATECAAIRQLSGRPCP